MAVDPPLRRHGEIVCGNVGGYRLIPSVERVPCARGIRGTQDRSAVIGRECVYRIASGGIECYGVPVDPPASVERKIRRGHGGGELPRPSRERISDHGRVCRTDQCRPVIRGDRGHLRSAVRVEADGIGIDRPRGRYRDIPVGDGQRWHDIPSVERMALSGRDVGNIDGTAVILHLRPYGPSVTVQERYGVGVDRPDSAECKVAIGDGRRDLSIPSCEGISLADRVIRDRDRLPVLDLVGDDV